MPIEARCSGCGRQYRLRDRLAGKKFRCRSCRTVVSVPDAPATSVDLRGDLEPDPSPDQAGPADYEFETPPTPRRRKSRRKRSRSLRRRGTGDGMPTTIMIAIGCEVALILFSLLNIIVSIASGELERIHARTPEVSLALLRSVFGCFVVLEFCIDGVAALGYVKRQNVIRWTSVVLTSMGLTCYGCSIVGLVTSPDAQGELLVFRAIYMIAGAILRFTLVVCLLLRPSSDWFQA